MCPNKRGNPLYSVQINEETPYIVPKYPHFLTAWTKFETFYFQIFQKRGNQLIRGKLISDKIENTC